MSEHPSRFMLERHCVGDLAPAERDKTVVHLESCPSCQIRVGEIKDEADRELARFPPEEFVAKLSVRMGRDVRRASQFRRWAAVSAAAAMAATAVLVIGLGRHDAVEQRGTVALRGSGLQIHRNRDGMAKLMENGDLIRAGDALRVIVTLPHPDPVDVWFVDATGRVDRLLATGALPMSAGEQALPGSAIVDAPCSDMWVVVGVGAQATSSAEAALKSLGSGPHTGDDWVPKGSLYRKLRCE
jgi:hypothetical protein